MFLSGRSLSKDFLKLKLLIAVIYIILEIYYRFFISEFDSVYMFYWGFNPGKYIITKLVFLIMLALSYLIYRQSKFLYTIYLLLIFFFYIPNAILFSLADRPANPFICTSFFVLFFTCSPYIKFNIPQIAVGEKYKSTILVGISLLVLVPIIFTFKLNINIKTLLLSEIYETRDIFSEKLTGLVAYLYHLAVKTVLPISLVFFMIKKKPVFIGFYVVILLYLFVISGNKVVYFTPIILVYFYYIGKTYISKITTFFLITSILFFIFPVIDFYVIKAPDPILIGTFVNRFLFIPAILTQWYFDFFEHNPLYFAESNFFKSFVQSPYDIPVGFLISKIYLNYPGVYANNGIVSDGYMNLGYLGVLLFSGMFSVLFSFFNCLNLNKGYYGLFFSYIFMFLSAPFLSCFITGGILIFIIIAIFILYDRNKSRI